MGMTEIILLLLGIGVFVASFVIPEKKGRLQEEDKRFGEEQIRELVEEQMKDVKTRVSDAVDETIQYAVEKTERSMERVTNEKIMAVNEYSDTVLEEIHKNHEEVVFLYDMLNDKQQNIKDTAAAVEKKAKEVRESIQPETSGTVETPQNGFWQEASGQSREGRKEAVKPAFVPLNVAEQETVSGQDGAIRRIEVRDALAGDTGLRGFAAENNAALTGGPAAGKTKATDIAAGNDAASDAAAYEAVIDSEAKMSVLQSVMAQNAAAQNAVWQDTAAQGVPFEGGAGQTMTAQDVLSKGGARQTGSAKSGGVEHAKAGKTKKRASDKAAKTTGAKERTGGMPAVGLSFASSGDEGRNNNEKILALHRAGKSNMAIAKELGLGIGEVKLVIDLFKGV